MNQCPEIVGAEWLIVEISVFSVIWASAKLPKSVVRNAVLLKKLRILWPELYLLSPNL